MHLIKWQKVIITCAIVGLFLGYSNYFLLKPAEASNKQAAMISEAMVKENQKNLVAHGGGAYNGYTKTNCLEAINQSYLEGFKLIELDFYRTVDKDNKIHYVLLHSEAFGSLYLGQAALDGVTFEEFTSLNQYPNLTLMTADQLDQWLGTHSDVRIIGDKLKADDYMIIGAKYPNLFKAFIPQVNSLETYYQLKAYGYKDIIFTVYSTPYTSNPATIAELSSQVQLFALTIPYETVKQLSPTDIAKIQQYNRIYSHEVNDLFQVNYLKSLKINGIYTDYFTPKTFWNNSVK